MVGLQALAAARALGAIDRPPVLFRLPGLPAVVGGAYRVAADLCEVRVLPWSEATPARPFAPAGGFARVIDLRDFAFDPGFRGVAMIDYFLARLGLDLGRVPPELRRNAWLAARLRPSPPQPGYVLVCPHSSMPLRDMPEPLHAALLEWLAVHAGRRILTQGLPVPGTEAVARAGDFAGLCALVAGASLIVTTDTAMVHLADAFGVWTVALFTTHRPEWRMRDYPRCRALHFPVPGLPEALEFARSAADEVAAAAAWPPLEALQPVLSRLLSATAPPVR